ncbi:MAG TPA: RidA family protein [Devosia sp.]|jgi:enamine deaminase RidA (YjgF/YER057c/UK114 family)|uniref:RidA family protein n=1 Tax=Devosia sp. TaxID=1871048 RepID=UPI002DDCFDF9|nr:RidA family protein [Devosia sp.]HEV2514570.1 RidA family protein [Devosia sp.]
MPVQHLNPETLHSNPVFTQAILVPAGTRTLLIGGQNAVDRSGEIVGKGDVAAQSAQALRNLAAVLEAAGAKLEDLVKVTVIIDHTADLRAAFGAWMSLWGTRANPPAVTVLRVAGLANPDYLIEVEAQAVLA